MQLRIHRVVGKRDVRSSKLNLMNELKLWRNFETRICEV